MLRIALVLLFGLGACTPYKGFYFAGVGGGGGSGQAGRWSGSFVSFEQGKVSPRGRGFTVEARGGGGITVPDDPELGIRRERVYLLRISPRVHLLGKFRRGLFAGPAVTPGYVTIGPGSTVSGGNVNFHLWGAGLMINAAPLGWARGAVGEFNMDTEYTYDPHAEIGAFGFAAIPFMYGLGIEAQAGIGYEDLSGTYVFFRIEVLALGHRLNRLPP